VSAAIVGLVGVVVGALLAAMQSAWLERRRDARETTTAERLIMAALGVAKRQLDTTTASGRWWPASLPLPLKTWSDQASKISPDIPEDDLGKLGTAFDVMEKLNALAASSRTESDDTPALTTPEIGELKKRLGNVEAAQGVLEARQSARSSRRLRSTIALIATLSVIVLAVVGLGAYTAVNSASEPPSVTASSLDSSIQAATNVNFASCTQQRNSSTAAWTCELADVSGTRCNPSLSSVAGSPVLSATFSPANGCSVTGEDGADVEVNSKSCWILEYLKGIPSPSDDRLAAGQPETTSQSPTASGCIPK
jgi:hypothetical protein